MQDSRAWSVNLGRWGGVSVYLHALFFLIGVFALYLAAHGTNDRELLWYAFATLVMLFGSVLLHESAHCLAAIKLGGSASEIVIGPFGGLAKLTAPSDSRSQLLVALAGPFANLCMAASGLFLLWVLGQQRVWGLLNPLVPEAIVEGSWRLVLLKLATWVNWLLVLVNLLPAHPFDGGRALAALLRPVWGHRTTTLVITRVAWCTAAAFCIAAWLLRDAQVNAHVPVWMPLVLLALFLFFSANHDAGRRESHELEEDYFDYGLTQNFGGYALEDDEETPPPEEEKGLLRRWLEKRREEKERLLRLQEEAEESRVDEILIRIHGGGLQELSAEERALLQRVSARYRNRQQSH